MLLFSELWFVDDFRQFGTGAACCFGLTAAFWPFSEQVVGAAWFSRGWWAGGDGWCNSFGAMSRRRRICRRSSAGGVRPAPHYRTLVPHAAFPAASPAYAPPTAATLEGIFAQTWYTCLCACLLGDARRLFCLPVLRITPCAGFTASTWWAVACAAPTRWHYRSEPSGMHLSPSPACRCGLGRGQAFCCALFML